MKIKLSTVITVPVLVWTLSFQPSFLPQTANTKNVCEGCLKCLEHAPNPLCNCQKVCALAAEKGCIVQIKACPD